jgi:hypothetical protein
LNDGARALEQTSEQTALQPHRRGDHSIAAPMAAFCVFLKF